MLATFFLRGPLSVWLSGFLLVAALPSLVGMSQWPSDAGGVNPAVRASATFGPPAEVGEACFAGAIPCEAVPSIGGAAFAILAGLAVVLAFGGCLALLAPAAWRPARGPHPRLPFQPPRRLRFAS